MDEIDRYASGNISFFVDQLRWETSPTHQEALMRLLIKEEHQLGAREERLQLAERILSDGADLIARQARRIAEKKSNGADASNAERTLRTFHMIQSLFENFRAHVCALAERLDALAGERAKPWWRGSRGSFPFRKPFPGLVIGNDRRPAEVDISR